MNRFALALVSLLAFSSLASAQTADPADRGNLLLRREAFSLPQPTGDPSELTLILPTSASQAWPTVLLIHGFAAPPSLYTSTAEILASRGYAVAIFDRVDRYETSAPTWVKAASETIDALERLASNPSSPVFGELDMTRLGVVGHSLGSLTALGLAATDPRVNTAVILAAPLMERDPGLQWAPQVPARVEVLFVSGELDRFGPTNRATDQFFAMTQHPKKLYVEIKGAGHLPFTDFALPFISFHKWRLRRSAPADQVRQLFRRYLHAWLDHHLVGKPDPEGYTDGRIAARDLNSDLLSRVELP